MMHHRGPAWSLLASLTLTAALLASAPAPAADAPAKPEAPAKALTLEDCLQLAGQCPRLVAARSSLAAAETARNAVEHLHAIPLVPGSRELPIRRQQACLGVEIAQAVLAQTEYDVVYDVTRLYYTVGLARQQSVVAQTAIKSLELWLPLVEADAKQTEKDKDYDETAYPKLKTYHALARARQAEAEAGVRRAVAALREAMGVGPECCLDEVAGQFPDDQNPLWRAQACGSELLDLALARRWELVQAKDLAQVFDLEVEAQGLTCQVRAMTFAAVGDIHAQAVPQAVRDWEYRPGGIIPEMPAYLVGSKCERQERASHLSARAGAMADKTRTLVALEVTDVYERWREAAAKQAETAAARKDAAAFREGANKVARNTPKKFDEVLVSVVLLAEAEVAWNEARFQYLNGLANLERVTAGGFHSGLSAPPPACASQH